MTREALDAWLGKRTPARPEPLALEMSRCIAACPGERIAAAASLSDALGEVGLHSLESVAASTSVADELALELLAADAFVTYAFEAAAEEHRELGPLALRLLAGCT